MAELTEAKVSAIIESEDRYQHAELNRTASRVTPPHASLTSPFIVAAIVYLALLLDNMLLTVIVPILPNYLATINNSTHHASLTLASSRNNSITGVSYRNLDPGMMLQQQPTLTKHPIPGKSMVNLSLLHLPYERPVLPVSASNQVDKAGKNSNSIEGFPDADSLTTENGSIGILLAMKALVQLVCNPIVGNLTTQYGYRIPIVVGTFCLLISSLVFAIGETYTILLVARAIQGIGSACIGVCGMSLVAQHYPEEERRSKVFGFILGSIALGVLLGYPFGGILYDLIGKSAPFIILSTIIFLNLGIQLLTMDISIQPEVVEESPGQSHTQWASILESHMILAIVIAIWFSTSTMAILEPCLPIWLLQNLKPNKWQLGTVFIPDSLGYFVGTNFFGSFAYKYGQVKISCISLLLVGISACLIPSASTVLQLLLPHFGLGLGIGIIDAALVPLLATFVDAQLAQEEYEPNSNASSTSSYGTVYAIQQTSVSLAYCLGPLIGGELAEAIGFAWLMRIVGVINMIYGPTLVYMNRKYDLKQLQHQQNELLLTGRVDASQYKKFYDSLDLE